MSAEVLLKALAQGLTTDERLVLYGAQGKARPWKPGTKVPPTTQSVSIVSSKGAGLALIVDIIGGKIPSDLMRTIAEPTFMVETAHRKAATLCYLLHVPERNAARFEAAARAFVNGGLMAPERVARLSGTIVHSKPNLRFTIDLLFKAFNLQRVPPTLRVITNDRIADRTAEDLDAAG